jgi:hypothetical protein
MHNLPPISIGIHAAYHDDFAFKFREITIGRRLLSALRQSWNASGEVMTSRAF